MHKYPKTKTLFDKIKLKQEFRYYQ